MQQVKVYAFGSFDGLHFGHISFLRQAKKLGHLTVIVARDSNIEIRKNRTPLFEEKARLARINGLKIADRVMLGQEGNRMDLLKTEQIDAICLGHDQYRDIKTLMSYLKKHNLEHIKIYRAKAFWPLFFKSSRLKQLKLIK